MKNGSLMKKITFIVSALALAISVASLVISIVSLAQRKKDKKRIDAIYSFNPDSDADFIESDNDPEEELSF